jgi:hypothetical protein
MKLDSFHKVTRVSSRLSKQHASFVPLFFPNDALIPSREIEVQLCKIPREKSMSSVRGTIFVHLWCCWQQEVRYINNNIISNSTKSNTPWRTTDERIWFSELQMDGYSRDYILNTGKIFDAYIFNSYRTWFFFLNEYIILNQTIPAATRGKSSSFLRCLGTNHWWHFRPVYAGSNGDIWTSEGLVPAMDLYVIDSDCLGVVRDIHQSNSSSYSSIIKEIAQPRTSLRNHERRCFNEEAHNFGSSVNNSGSCYWNPYLLLLNKMAGFPL